MDSAPEARSKLIGLFGDCLDLLPLVDLAEERMSENLSLISSTRDSFIVNCSKATVAEFTAGTKAREASSMFDLVGDVVASLTAQDLKPLDRDALIKQSRILLDIFEKSDLNNFEKRSVTLKLTSLIRTVDQCRDLSDAQVKRRVKAIYADYCSDFDRLDNTALYKAMTEWASSICTHGVNGLSLAISLVGVSGYIEDHSSETKLPPPSYIVEKAGDDGPR